MAADRSVRLVDRRKRLEKKAAEHFGGSVEGCGGPVHKEGLVSGQVDLLDATRWGFVGASAGLMEGGEVLRVTE